MHLYEYVAVTNEGKKISGSLLAEDYKNAYDFIKSKKNQPISIKTASTTSQKVSIEDLLMFFLHIDLQLKCKVRINDAIESFLELHGNKILKNSLAAILIDLKNGTSLGEAFEKCNNVFDNITIGLLKSAERTGKLSDIISNILKFLKLKAEWKNSITHAIAYPIFVACVAICVLAFSIMFLGPQIYSLIKDFGDGEIPLLTNILVNYAPDFLKIVICIGIPLFSIGILCFSFNKKLRFFIIDIILRLPTIGPLIIKTNFWQVCKILHIALDAKLDFMNALDIAIESIKIENIRQELYGAQKKIIEGYSISASFSSAKFISETIISAIDIGEEGSDLSASFSHVSNNQYEEIMLDIKTFGQKLTVGLTLFTGFIFILIICGLFFPIYSYIEFTGM